MKNEQIEITTKEKNYLSFNDILKLEKDAGIFINKDLPLFEILEYVVKTKDKPLFE